MFSSLMITNTIWYSFRVFQASLYCREIATWGWRSYSVNKTSLPGEVYCLQYISGTGTEITLCSRTSYWDSMYYLKSNAWEMAHSSGTTTSGKAINPAWKKTDPWDRLILNIQLCHQQIKINWNLFSLDKKVSFPLCCSSAVPTASSDETGACKLISLMKHTLVWISQNTLADSHPGPRSWSTFCKYWDLIKWMWLWQQMAWNALLTLSAITWIWRLYFSRTSSGSHQRTWSPLQLFAF